MKHFTPLNLCKVKLLITYVVQCILVFPNPSFLLFKITKHLIYFGWLNHTPGFITGLQIFEFSYARCLLLLLLSITLLLKEYYSFSLQDMETGQTKSIFHSGGI